MSYSSSYHSYQSSGPSRDRYREEEKRSNYSSYGHDSRRDDRFGGGRDGRQMDRRGEDRDRGRERVDERKTWEIKFKSETEKLEWTKKQLEFYFSGNNQIKFKKYLLDGRETMEVDILFNMNLFTSYVYICVFRCEFTSRYVYDRSNV
jgi:hypothetical protein